MKEETIEKVYGAMNYRFYTTRRVLRVKTGLSPSAVENAIEELMSDDDIEKIHVKCVVGVGGSEVAYRKARK